MLCMSNNFLYIAELTVCFRLSNVHFWPTAKYAYYTMSQKNILFFGLLQLWHIWTEVFRHSGAMQVGLLLLNTKTAFFTHSISALPEFNQSLLDFFNLFDSRLILTLLYDFLNSCNQCVQLWLLGAWFRRKEVKSTAAVGLCCTHNARVHCLLGFLLCKVTLKH